MMGKENLEVEQIIDAYNAIWRESFAHHDGIYQGKKETALRILTKLLIDRVLDWENETTPLP